MAAVVMGCDKDESFVTEAEVKAEVNGAVDNAIPHCTPGRSVDCPCPMGASGVQTCAADGKSYSACSDCWNPLPQGGSSSSSSGGDAQKTQKVMCPQPGVNVEAYYAGMKAEELFSVRVITHDPGAKPGEPAFSTVGGNFADGYVRAGCPGDYDIFIGP